MKIERRKLLDHLKAVILKDLVPQAAFSGPFASAAVSADNTVIVLTDGVPGMEVGLEEAIGVLDLGLVVRALEVSSADMVEVGVRDQRITVTAGRSRIALVTAAPEGTTGHLSAAAVDRLLEISPKEGDGLPVDPGAASELLGAMRLLDADSVTLKLGKRVSGVLVGRGTENQALVEFPGVTYDQKDERILAAPALREVLSLATEDTRTWLGEEGGTVIIETGAVTYYLSALAPEA